MFVTTLPIIFAFTNLISPIELILILLAIFMGVFRFTSEPDPTIPSDPYKSFYLYLHAAWLGNTRLKWVFWPFFVLVNIVFYYIDYRIGNDTYTISSWKTVHSMIFLPIVWWTVAVWRCSPHTANRYWSSAARAMTIYVFVELLLRAVLVKQFPHLLFDCKLLLLEFGDCR